MSIYGAVPGGYLWRPALRRGPGGQDDVEVVESIDGLIDEARFLLGKIEQEIARLANEIFLLKAGRLVSGGVFFDPLEFGPEIEAFENVILELEDFVGGPFLRVEKKALAGDLDAARRLRDSTARIMGAAQTSSPLRDRAENLARTIDDATGELASFLDKAVKVVGFGLVVYVGVSIIRLLIGR